MDKVGFTILAQDESPIALTLEFQPGLVATWCSLGMNQGTLKSSIKPREGRHEISQGFAQYSKHRSPFRASIQLAFFPWLYAMDYNLSPHSGLKWVPLGSYPEPMTWNPPESNDSLPRLSCNLVNTKKPFSIEPNAAAFQDLFPATLIAVSINDPSFKNQATDNSVTICHRWRLTGNTISCTSESTRRAIPS